jgi:hypothetical protein
VTVRRRIGVRRGQPVEDRVIGDQFTEASLFEAPLCEAGCLRKGLAEP